MPQPLSEKSRQGADKRQLILDSAIKVFADKGYHGTRISDIARQAEIAYGLVYHYFKNKEDILDAIFFERWGGFMEAVEAIAADGRPLAARLLSIAEVILSSYRERSEWVKVLVFEIQRSQRFADPARIKAVGELSTAIATMLREGQANGELRDDLDADLACYIFIGGLDIVVTSRVIDLIPVKGDEGAYFGQIAQTVVDLFLNGMRRPEAKPSASESAPVPASGNRPPTRILNEDPEGRS
jgi:TetR/AcrR family fatty acid metabolism transcriptional regulator